VVCKYLLFIFPFVLGPLFRKTVADSNAPVQEKALDALIAFLRAADADDGRYAIVQLLGLTKFYGFVIFLLFVDSDYLTHAFRYAKEVCDAIVAKCLTGRPKTVEKAQAAFMLWVELEAVEVFLVLST